MKGALRGINKEIHVLSEELNRWQQKFYFADTQEELMLARDRCAALNQQKRVIQQKKYRLASKGKRDE